MGRLRPGREGWVGKVELISYRSCCEHWIWNRGSITKAVTDSVALERHWRLAPSLP